jgi:hypothetical protein
MMHGKGNVVAIVDVRNHRIIFDIDRINQAQDCGTRSVFHARSVKVHHLIRT